MKWPGLVGIFKIFFRYILKSILFITTGFINTFIYLFSKFSHIILFKGFFKTYLIFGIILSIILSILLGFYIASISRQQIDISKLKEYKPITSSKVFDEKGNFVTEFANEKRYFIPIQKIPKNLINAFISAEDRTFYQNNGIDLQGLTRVIFKNAIYLFSGKKLHGASTITQQVVRNTILSKERTLTRKIKEMILSYKISKIMKKDEIMEVYLNQIYLGSGAYGVGAASEEYFGKDVSELNINEAALIASLAKAPSSLDPRKGKSQTLARRNWVLYSMLEEKYINQQEYDLNVKESISLVDKKSVKKPYSFMDYLAYHLETEKKITKDQLYNNGYDIKSTLDQDIYQASYEYLNEGIIEYDRRHGYKGPIGKCEDVSKIKDFLNSFDLPERIGSYKVAVVKSIEDEKANIELENNKIGEIKFENLKWARKRLENLKLGSEIKSIKEVLSSGDVIIVSKINEEEYQYKLEQIPDIDGAVVVMRVKDGAVLSLIGGYLDIPGGFNRAYQAQRQPGSTAKTFSYLALLENGFKPSDIVVDSEVSINAGDGSVYIPRNVDRINRGAMTLRKAYYKSLNVPLIRSIYEIGPDKLINLLNRLDVKTNAQPVLSSAIGSFETNLIEMIKGYCIIANGGIKISVTPAISVEIRKDEKDKFKNEQIKTNESLNNTQDSENIEEIEDAIIDLINSDQIINSDVNYQMISMLQGSATYGTAAKFGQLSANLIGKTGTTDNSKDLWFIGGSSEIIIGVYIGNDTPTSLGSNEFGGTVALPIAKKIMEKIIKIYPPKQFKIPNGIKLLNINPENGLITNGKNGIKEVFKESDKLPTNEEDSINSIESGIY